MKTSESVEYRKYTENIKELIAKFSGTAQVYVTDLGTNLIHSPNSTQKTLSVNLPAEKNFKSDSEGKRAFI